jgi:hypothetical protein
LPPRSATAAGSTFFIMIAGIELVAKLGRHDHDAVATMAAVLVAVALFAYWILRA